MSQKGRIWRVFLLGSGISRSISPLIQNKAFREFGFKATYSLLDVDNSEFASTILKIRLEKDVLGFNITAPFKERIIPYLAELDPQSEAIGAVNTVKIEPVGKMVGFNTDVDGIIASLSKLGLLASVDGRATVLGAGGAARACVYSLAVSNFKYVTVLNRTLSKAESVTSHFQHLFPKLEFEAGRLNEREFKSAISTSDVLINAVSDSTSTHFPIKLDFSTAKKGLKILDLGYKGTSLLMKNAKKCGIEGIDGLLMLVEQAARSFEIWTGISAPRKTMILAARHSFRS